MDAILTGFTSIYRESGYLSKKSRLYIGLGALGIELAVLIMLFSNLAGSAESEEISRQSSPDGLVDAVIVEVNGGATTSFTYKVFIVPKSQAVPEEGELFLADHVEDLKSTWAQNKVLVVKYRHARIFHFSNFWQAEEIQNFRYTVEVQLAPQVKGYALSERDR